MEKRVYQTIPPISLELAREAFASENPERIADALLRLALHYPDRHPVQAYCLQFLTFPDLGVQKIAAQSLGHLARLHRQLDRETVLPALERLKANPALTGAAEDALDDIHMFLDSR